METFYRIIEKDKKVKHGLILKLNFNNEIKCLAGEDWDKDKKKILEKINIVHDNSKILQIAEGYEFSEIKEGEANVLIHDWNYFLGCVMEGGYNPEIPWRDM